MEPVREEAAAGGRLARLVGASPWSSVSAASPQSTASRSTSVAGEIVGLIGPNGAGKTTLFDLPRRRAEADLRPHLARRGRGRIQRRRIRGSRTASAAPSRSRARFPGMTLVENVMLGAQGQSGERIWPNWLAPRRVAREERACRDKAMDLLDFVTLDELAARAGAGSFRRPAQAARTRPRADGRAVAAAARRAGRGGQSEPPRGDHRAHRRDQPARRRRCSSSSTTWT